MLKFCERFLRHRRLVVVLFIIAAIAGLIAIPRVKVDYNIVDYLPEDAVSVQALHTMEDNFGGIPNARLYAEGITQAEADELATKLGQIDGITDVMWLGTQVDLKQPIEVADQDLVNHWKSDDGYLYQLTLDDNKAADAAAAARSLGDQVGASRISLGGSAVDIADAQTSTAVEIVYILAAAIGIVILILGLTSSSWFEPVIFLIVIGVAIALNMGTNLIQGKICFITQICGAVLQLAVSMDYAIVMLHTFRRQQRTYADPTEAMAHAMVKGFSVIISSAAVTFFGFLSLAVMRFQVGLDMGIVLAKGIAFSFLSVMFFMPCLLLCCLKTLDRFEHRSLIPPFDKFARGCQRLMVPLAIIVVLITPIAYLAQENNSWEYGASNFAAPGSETRIEADRINDVFGTNENWVVMVPEGQWGNEQALIDDLKKLDMISGVTSYITVAGRAMPVNIAETAQGDTVSQVISNGWSRIVLSTDVTGENQQAFDLVETVRNLAHEYYGDNYGLVGTQVSVYDLKEVVTADTLRVQLFSSVAIGIVLMLMFRSISIPILTLAAIKIAIMINMACAYFTGTTIAYIGYLVIDAVQMGAAVDYAIIFEREYFDRRKLYLPREAARSAVKHSALTIMTSAMILTLAGLAVSWISSNQIIAGIGVLIGRGAFVSMIMMFVFLPGLFTALDWVVRHTTIHMQYLRKGETPPTPESIGLVPEEPRQPSKRQLRKQALLAAQADGDAAGTQATDAGEATDAAGASPSRAQDGAATTAALQPGVGRPAPAVEEPPLQARADAPAGPAPTSWGEVAEKLPDAPMADDGARPSETAGSVPAVIEGVVTEDAQPIENPAASTTPTQVLPTVGDAAPQRPQQPARDGAPVPPAADGTSRAEGRPARGRRRPKGSPRPPEGYEGAGASGR